MKKKLFFVLLVIVLLIAACIPSQEQVNEIINSVEQTALAQVAVVAPTQDVNTIVQAAFQSLTVQAATSMSAASAPATESISEQVISGTDVISTFTPHGGQIGSISGTLTYPAEGLAAMAVVAFHAGGSPTDYYYVATSQGQSNYQIDNLPVGDYWIVAYSLGGAGFPAGLAGGYTQYVACGMQPPCSNHALMEVTVNSGQVTGKINPQDWYAPEGILPENPLP